MISLTYSRLFWQGSLIGLRGLSLAGIRVAGLKRAVGFFLQPIENWSRYPELMTVQECLGDITGKKVLDLGSPKMLGFILARNQKARLLLTDIWKVPVNEVRAILERNKSSLKGSIALETADLTDLKSIRDAEFDAVYSVSVVEHIESKAAIRKGLAEMCRVTTQGGLVVVSVPIRSGYFKEYHSGSVYGQDSAQGPVFFSHYFDKATATEVFASCPGLKIEQLFISQWQTDSRILYAWRKVPQKIRGFFGFINMLIASKAARVLEARPDFTNIEFPKEGDLIIKYRKI